MTDLDTTQFPSGKGAMVSNWCVFTKPWRDCSESQLGQLISGMGFNAIEFPLRAGYQVDLDNLGRSFRQLRTTLEDFGVSIASVAGTAKPDESVLATCAENGVPLVRVMLGFETDCGYIGSRDSIRRRLDGLSALALKHGVAIGVQPHYDNYISDSRELATLLRDYDSRAVTAIWDAAHDGLARKHPRYALELLWDRLSMVNFKNACYSPSTTPNLVPWEIEFVPGADGLGSWSEAAEYLGAHHWSGPVCLPAEYTDEESLEAKVTADLAYLRGLLAERA